MIGTTIEKSTAAEITFKIFINVALQTGMGLGI
jgi:hypothetical protein